MKTEKLEAVSSQGLTYTGGGGAVVAGLSLNELGVIVGIAVGVLGLALQIWFGLRRDARERALHKRKMSDTQSPE